MRSSERDGPGGQRRGTAPPQTNRGQPRRVSRTRRMFLTAIWAQLNGTRILAALTLLVLGAGGVFWLVATTGSPVVGLSFIALAAALAVTTYWFVRVMSLLGGRR